jgi:hypothetical protein
VGVASDEIETEHPGYLLSQDTFYVGYLKGVGRIYQQTVIDTHSAVTFGKVYSAKGPVTVADPLNDRVLPFFEEEGVPVLRVLTNREPLFSGIRCNSRLDGHFRLILSKKGCRAPFYLCTHTQSIFHPCLEGMPPLHQS